jgi:hypothetical protein
MDGAPDVMAIDPDDNVAIAENDRLFVSDRERRRQSPILRTGADYEIKSVQDLAYDSLGHLYVLDRSRGAVLVFSPAGKFVAKFEPAEKAPGAFRKPSALAVDRAGRLYIYDERAQAVQVYE